MKFLKIRKNKKKNKSIDVPIETEILYSNKNKQMIIDGIELPKVWENLNQHELKNHARIAIEKLSKHSNSDFKAKELGFSNAKHLMDLCFNYILK